VTWEERPLRDAGNDERWRDPIPPIAPILSEQRDALAGMLAVRAAVLCVDAKWAAQYAERFAAELLDELDRAGYRVVKK